MLFVLCYLSCSKSDEVLNTIISSNGLSYSDSIREWQKLKKQNGNSYSYEIIFASFAGFGSTTAITVKDGKVIERKYEAYRDNTNEREITDTYIENESNLGINERGALPKTIDELYATCANEYLRVDEETNIIYFETADATGILSLCGFYPKGCADDCFMGIRLKNFKWLN